MSTRTSRAESRRPRHNAQLHPRTLQIDLGITGVPPIPLTVLSFSIAFAKSMPFCATWEEAAAAAAAGAGIDGAVLDPSSKTYGSLKYECGSTADEFYVSYFPTTDTTCTTTPLPGASRVRFAVGT